MTLEELWQSADRALWSEALEGYWTTVAPSRLKVEEEMAAATAEKVANFDAEEWWNFLLKFYQWKYTQANRLKTSLNHLHRHDSERGLKHLLTIRDRLLALDPADAPTAIHIASRPPGLGIAGATGLLSILYPAWFGTLDRFVVLALCRVEPEVREWQELAPNSLEGLGGVMLTHRLRVKAADLTERLGQSWTPRMVDKVLWAVRS